MKLFPLHRQTGDANQQRQPKPQRVKKGRRTVHLPGGIMLGDERMECRHQPHIDHKWNGGQKIPEQINRGGLLAAQHRDEHGEGEQQCLRIGVNQGEDSRDRAGQPEIRLAPVARAAIQPKQDEHHQCQRIGEQRVPQEAPEGVHVHQPQIGGRIERHVSQPKIRQNSAKAGGNAHQNRGGHGLKTVESEVIGVFEKGEQKQNDPGFLQYKQRETDVPGKQAAQPSGNQEKWLEQKRRMRQRREF